MRLEGEIIECTIIIGWGPHSSVSEIVDNCNRMLSIKNIFSNNWGDVQWN